MKKQAARWAIALAALSGGALAASTGAATGIAPAGADISLVRPAPVSTARVCPRDPRRGYATCFAIAIAGPTGRPLSAKHPLATGMTPDDVQSAYHLKGLESGGRTVAIVAAYGYSSLEDDLKVYRETFGLPPCTTNNGCLKILDQHGGNHYPRDDRSWDLEQALDVDAVSAACPDCKIIVVQAKTADLSNLSKAVDEAARHDVVAISNSYGGSSHKNLASYDHPGIAITAATGDNGYRSGAYPADDSHVVAVGGTRIVQDATTKRGWTETAWAAAGSACSEKNKRPPWQRHAKTTCRGRAVADVAAAADPRKSGLAVYYGGRFHQIGGTSESTPIIAAVYALSGRTDGYPARYPYRMSGRLYDIQEGRNGSCGAPLCQARRGWDGPTGVGTPNGVRGF